jgi:diguanylate cyclase (GGDEF)-like protein/putative nucleotidyltransferase with HDIG domain
MRSAVDTTVFGPLRRAVARRTAATKDGALTIFFQGLMPAATGGTRARLRDDRRLRLMGLASAAWLTGYAIALALSNAGRLSGKVLNDGFYLLPVALSAATSYWAAKRAPRGQRRFWGLLAVSNAVWLIGEIIWSLYVVVGGRAPFPSVADAFYLSSYALVPVAVLTAFSGRRLRAVRSLLDASIAAVAVGAAGYLVTISPQLSSGFALGTATSIAYPLLGVVILVLIVAFGFGGHQMVPVDIALVGVAFAISAATDALYTYVADLHSLVPGQWLNLGWQAEALILSMAAWVAVRYGRDPARVRRFERDLGLPMVLIGLLMTVALVVIDARDGRLSLATLLAAGYCLIAVIARLYLTGRDRERLARELERALLEQERLAVTDGLTGLHNRRFFDELLTLECERSGRQRTELSLIVIDLDHFKQVNDRQGHPAGDVVLLEVARRLRHAVRGSDIVARYGGEEFAVILPDAGAARARLLAERIRAAVAREPVTVEGRPLAVTASVGVATMRAPARSKNELLRRADRALYRAKRLGRNQVQVDNVDAELGLVVRDANSPVIDYLQNLADEIDGRQASSVHSVAMAAWAGRIAAALGADEQQRERVVVAARFHDIGKVVVPDAMLCKQGPLTEDEWQVIREHPEQGARLARLAPELEDVAPIIAAHHERPDGQGYPRGLAGEAIPLEARIIAVCDAWSAMRTDRSYRRALSQADAVEQLRRGKGTQFDPAVIDAFVPLALADRLEQPLADLPLQLDESLQN